MLILGLSGGPSLISEKKFDLEYNMFHDAAAVLMKDGEILAAIEEERLNRIKHTNKAPILAIRACLEKCGFTLGDIDKIAIYCDKKTYNDLKYKNLRKVSHNNDRENYLNDYRDYVNRYFSFEFHETVDKDKILPLRFSW